MDDEPNEMAEETTTKNRQSNDFEYKKEQIEMNGLTTKCVQQRR